MQYDAVLFQNNSIIFCHNLSVLTCASADVVDTELKHSLFIVDHPFPIGLIQNKNSNMPPLSNIDLSSIYYYSVTPLSVKMS